MLGPARTNGGILQKVHIQTMGSYFFELYILGRV